VYLRSNVANILEQSMHLLWTLQWPSLVAHEKVVHNLVQALFVNLFVVERNGKFLRAKSTNATDPVEVVLRIANNFSFHVLHQWNVEVDHDLNLRHVNTTREYGSSDDH
jgi:hypothetical protein